MLLPHTFDCHSHLDSHKPLTSVRIVIRVPTQNSKILAGGKHKLFPANLFGYVLHLYSGILMKFHLFCYIEYCNNISFQICSFFWSWLWEWPVETVSDLSFVCQFNPITIRNIVLSPPVDCVMFKIPRDFLPYLLISGPDIVFGLSLSADSTPSISLSGILFCKSSGQLCHVLKYPEPFYPIY